MTITPGDLTGDMIADTIIVAGVVSALTAGCCCCTWLCCLTNSPDKAYQGYLVNRGNFCGCLPGFGSYNKEKRRTGYAAQVDDGEAKKSGRGWKFWGKSKKTSGTGSLMESDVARLDADGSETDRVEATENNTFGTF